MASCSLSQAAVEAVAVEAACPAATVHNGAARWNKSLLDHGARPSGALVYANPEAGDRLSESQFETLKAEPGDAADMARLLEENDGQVAAVMMDQSTP